LSDLRDKITTTFSLSTVSSLQLFQLTRYSGFVLIGIAFANLGIAKSEIGQFESFLWLMGLFSFFWIAGLMNSMLSVYARQSENEKKQLLFTAFILIMFISLIAGIVQMSTGGGSILGLCYLMTNNASYMAEYILYLHHERKKLIIYGLIIALIQLILCVTAEYLFDNVELALMGLLIVSVVKFLYVLWLIRSYTITILDWKKVKALFTLALPLMLSFFVTGSAEYIDGAVVKHYFTISDFSIFRYGSRDFPLFTILAATLSMSMIPEIAADLHTGLSTLRDKSLRYMHFFFPLAMVMILMSKWLFTVFFSAQFADSGKIFAALMLLTIPRLVFPQAILTALKENQLTLLVSIAEMLVNVVASILFVQNWGLVGVAMGTVVAFTFEKILMVSILYIWHNIKPGQYIAIKPYAIYSLMTIAFYLISLYM